METKPCQSVWGEGPREINVLWAFWRAGMMVLVGMIENELLEWQNK